MPEWILKQGYKTRLLADENELNLPGTQIQLIRFKSGKYTHHHEKKTEFFYFTKGEGKVIIKGKEKKIVPGSTVLIKPNIKHSFINESGSILEAIMFKTNNSNDDTYDE